MNKTAQVARVAQVEKVATGITGFAFVAAGGDEGAGRRWSRDPQARVSASEIERLDSPFPAENAV